MAGTFQAPLVKAAGLFQAFTRNFAYGVKALIDQRGGGRRGSRSRGARRSRGRGTGRGRSARRPLKPTPPETEAAPEPEASSDAEAPAADETDTRTRIG